MANQYTGSKYTEEDCIESLQEAARQLGKSPSGPEYTELGMKPGRSAVKRLCGGWNKAKEKAGLESWDGNPAYLSVNHSYFSNIDSPEKAYWLGFLYADGSVKEKYNTVSIQLKKEDEEHLREFADAVESEHKIQDIETKTSHKCGIDVISEEMVLDLISHGCIPKKTHEDTMPDLREDMKPHFIRGLFDGDGSFGLYEHSGRTHLRWVFTGSSVSRLETIVEWLEEEGGIGRKMVGDYDYSSPRVQYSSVDDMMKLWSTLFPDGRDTEPALSRKKSSIAEFVESY